MKYYEIYNCCFVSVFFFCCFFIINILLSGRYMSTLHILFYILWKMKSMKKLHFLFSRGRLLSSIFYYNCTAVILLQYDVIPLYYYVIVSTTTVRLCVCVCAYVCVQCIFSHSVFTFYIISIPGRRGCIGGSNPGPGGFSTQIFCLYI